MVHHYQLSAICHLLFPQPQSPDNVSVAFRILSIQIRQVTPALPDQLQQSPPRMFIVLVISQVLNQVIDPVRQQRDLHLRGAGVCGMHVIFPYDGCLILP